MADQGPGKLLYYRTREQIREWRRVLIADKLARLQAQTEFFHKTMSDRSKRIREKLKS